LFSVEKKTPNNTNSLEGEKIINLKKISKIEMVFITIMKKKTTN